VTASHVLSQLSYSPTGWFYNTENLPVRQENREEKPGHNLYYYISYFELDLALHFPSGPDNVDEIYSLLLLKILIQSALRQSSIDLDQSDLFSQ